MTMNEAKSLFIVLSVVSVASTCPSGYYGYNCTLSCSSSCKDGRCHPGHGTCDVCVDRFWGGYCNQSCSPYCRDRCGQFTGDCEWCKVGYWTENCTDSCPGHCDKYGCGRENGNCVGECLSGYYGVYCNQTCPSGCSSCKKESGVCSVCHVGNHGTFCNLTCPLHCDGECNKATGNCYKCIDGHWGLNCTKKCEHRCICDQMTGNCTGCYKGYCGPVCEKVCPTRCDQDVCNKVTCECDRCRWDAYMGPYCQFSCPGPCDHHCNINGICHRCDPGSKKYGPNCDKDCANCSVDCHKNTGYCPLCINGTYGPDCERSCDANCKVCDHDTGECTLCEPGYWGNSCNLPCPINCHGFTCHKQFGFCDVCHGFFGLQCESPCPDNCLYCHPATGYCRECPKGFYGNRCNKTCPINCVDGQCDQTYGVCVGCNGYFGDHCEEPCPEHCDECSKSTGVCHDCKLGWWGSYCNNTCHENCQASKCGRDTGLCETCLPGYWGQYCTEICLSDNCIDEDGQANCNQHDGYCASCEQGFWGKDCKTSCSINCHGGCQKTTGYCLSCSGHAHGSECETPCGKHCRLQLNNPNYEICNREGVCTGGCMIGWYGLMCNGTCQNCMGSGCDRNTGICSAGCLTGYVMNKYNVCVDIEDVEDDVNVTYPTTSAVTNRPQTTANGVNTTRVGETVTKQFTSHNHTLGTASFVIGLVLLLAIITLVIAGAVYVLYWKRKVIKERSSSAGPPSIQTLDVPTGEINLGLEVDNSRILMMDDGPQRNSMLSSESNSSGFMNVGIPSESSTGYDYVRPTGAYMDLNNESRLI